MSEVICKLVCIVHRLKIAYIPVYKEHAYMLKKKLQGENGKPQFLMDLSVPCLSILLCIS